ncbi:MAG: hypothetical protein H7268_02310 [Sandarakinorhabdus sp.]|nr:hypothetical protein [Sandarakinorhabdus sp.]
MSNERAWDMVKHLLLAGFSLAMAGTAAAAPKVITGEIKLNTPIWDWPPPTDNARPNETSWTYFTKKTDVRRVAEKAATK